MPQAAVQDGLAFDPFSFLQNGRATPEVDIGRREVAQALVVAPMIVVLHEGADLGLQVSRQVVVLEQDPVFERLVPALDLALRLRVVGSTPDCLTSALARQSEAVEEERVLGSS